MDDGHDAGTVQRPSPGKRGAYLLAQLTGVPAGISVRGLGGSRRGEMQIRRFLLNPKVAVSEIVMSAAARTARLVKDRDVLAIQDTTSLRDDGVPLTA